MPKLSQSQIERNSGEFRYFGSNIGEAEPVMEYFSGIVPAIVDNWPVWTVTIVLILAAVIDGFELKVPNWVTFPLVISGWVYSVLFAHTLGLAWYEGLGWSLFGTVVGLALLLPAYAIGGMG
ncbi:MAG: prepilin peptidase, partial [Gemmatimonadaceae bacterium]|nr:prepilin peptidase [Gemmatimonadaceae bacterium]